MSYIKGSTKWMNNRYMYLQLSIWMAHVWLSRGKCLRLKSHDNIKPILFKSIVQIWSNISLGKIETNHKNTAIQTSVDQYDYVPIYISVCVYIMSISVSLMSLKYSNDGYAKIPSKAIYLRLYRIFPFGDSVMNIFGTVTSCIYPIFWLRNDTSGVHNWFASSLIVMELSKLQIFSNYILFTRKWQVLRTWQWEHKWTHSFINFSLLYKWELFKTKHLNLSINAVV